MKKNWITFYTPGSTKITINKAMNLWEKKDSKQPGKKAAHEILIREKEVSHKHNNT